MEIRCNFLKEKCKVVPFFKEMVTRFTNNKLRGRSKIGVKKHLIE